MRLHRRAHNGASNKSLLSAANLWSGRLMEPLWLTAIGLVPIVFAPPNAMLFLDLPKVTLLRSLVALMAMA